MYDSQKAHYLVVTGIVIKDGKFLITKRSPTEKAFPNQWTVPGGKLELDDYAKRPKDTSLQSTKVKQAFGVDIPHWKDALKRFFEEVK